MHSANAGLKVALGRKNLPNRHELPAIAARTKCKNALFYWVFHHGTALADKSA
jgi:hypothetical protein